MSAVWQKRVALIAGIVLLAWAGVTLAVLGNQMLSSGERAEVAAQKAAAAAAEARIAKYRDRVAETAADLEERQDQLDEWSETHFGVEPAAVTPEAGAEAKAAPATLETSALETGAIDPNLPPEAQALARIEKRQERFAARLLAAVNERAAKAEVAVAKLGLDPRALVRNAASGRGGPFIPYRGTGKAKAFGASFAALEGALFRMEVLERTLVAVPSGKPADVLMLSSSFGYRSDPFTGAGAMHAGLDFPGPLGTPILAAAPGRVVFVGQKSGYGNVVEVDHGQGILTRYAHLSGFNTAVGAQVAAGQQIAKMGSTGRSTGSHLHFEVRLNGVAVNPRRFLEAKADVLEVKDDARQRVGALATSRTAS